MGFRRIKIPIVKAAGGYGQKHLYLCAFSSRPDRGGAGFSPFSGVVNPKYHRHFHGFWELRESREASPTFLAADVYLLRGAHGSYEEASG